MSTVPVYTVDSFSREAFRGNPCAVCLVPKQGLSNEQMQNIAAEMNISETAFITQEDEFSEDGFKTKSAFNLRWFTPMVEVNLCGHGTMAAAAILESVCGNATKDLCFSTLSGVLHVKPDPDARSYCMDLPKNAPVDDDVDNYRALIEIVADGLPVVGCAYSATTKKLLVRLDDSVTREQLVQCWCAHAVSRTVVFTTSAFVCMFVSVYVCVGGERDQSQL
eukprot:m.292242 g.292242  ORF g.292242 m.292242 type:complete len:221 (-) comp19995_c1_seq12:1264-1926(-)